MNPPLAYATLKLNDSSYAWHVHGCPLCGDEHIHDGGPLGGNPRERLGCKIGHCQPNTDSFSQPYFLVESTRPLKSPPGSLRAIDAVGATR
jgi:hypothetical protein